MRNELATAVLLAATLAACGARSSLAVVGGGRDGGAPIGSGRDGGAPIGERPEKLVRGAVVEVCAMPSCNLYSRLHALVWTGERYALLFDERRLDDHAIFAALRLIETDGRVSGSMRISQPEENVFSATMIWDGERLAVFWRCLDSDELRFRALDGDGQPLGAARSLLDRLSDRHFAVTPVATQEGYAVLIVAADHRARFVRLSAYPELALLADPVRLYWPEITEPWDHPFGLLALPSGDFAAGLNPRHGDDYTEAAHLVWLDGRGQPRGDPLLVFRSDESVVGGAPMIGEDGRLWVSYNDDFERVYLAEVSGASWQIGQRIALQHEGDISGAVLEPTGPRSVAMLSTTNLWQGPGSFPTTLVFETFALPGGERTGKLVVDGGPDEFVAMSEHRMVRSGDGFGLAWQPDRSHERILFARVARR